MLIAGNGRNVGKTALACKLISQLCSMHMVIALKISSHLHPLDDNQNFIAKEKDFAIIEESNITMKDSSKMLQAGATKSYYIQTKDNALLKAFNLIKPYLPISSPIVCESAGLGKFVKPGKAIYISNSKNVPKGNIYIKPDIMLNENFSFKNISINYNQKYGFEIATL